MMKKRLKLAAISALQAEPHCKKLRLLHSCADRDVRRFLRWLDESGLALYLLARLQQSREIDHLPPGFICELQRRLESNRKRADTMLSEVQKLSALLEGHSIPHAFLKGFALVPDFCPAMELRHQSDIDILISAESLGQARQVMYECGYAFEDSLRTGEIHFSKPRNSLPSIHDDIYTPAFHPDVEFHPSIWNNLDFVALTAPGNCLLGIRVHEVNTVRFACLSLEDMFVAQILHAFRHLLGSWIRVAWIFEIHSFILRYSEDTSLWHNVRARAGDDPALRDAVGLIFQLTNRLFPSPIPQLMRDWCVEPLPDTLNQWVAEFGIRWALSDLSGSKLSLFVHTEFIQNRRSRRAYLWRRLLPLQGKPTIGRVEPDGGKMILAVSMAQGMFLANRALFHARSFVSFGFDAIRWTRILHSGLKQRATTS